MNSNEREKVPLFRKWIHWYILVIVWLVACIVLFYFFTKFFS